MSDRDSRSLARSQRVYGALVALYPRDFRTQYSREMRLAWWQLCRDAYRRKRRAGACRRVDRRAPGAVDRRPVRKERGYGTYGHGSGRVRGFKAIMAANATVLILFGIALFVAGTNVVVAYGLVEPTQVPGPNAPDEAWSVLLPAKLMAQTLGVALIGVGGLALTARAGVRTHVGAGPAGALGATHSLLALAFLVTLIQYPSVLGWVTVAVAGAFGLVYLWFWFTETVTWDAETQHSAGHAPAHS